MELASEIETEVKQWFLLNGVSCSRWWIIKIRSLAVPESLYVCADGSDLVLMTNPVLTA